MEPGIGKNFLCACRHTALPLYVRISPDFSEDCASALRWANGRFNYAVWGMRWDFIEMWSDTCLVGHENILNTRCPARCKGQ